MSRKEETKAQRERELFSRFAQAARLQVQPGTLRSGDPPEPDISCIIGQQAHYFELSEIVDQGLAHRVGIALNEMKITGGVYSQTEPLVQTFLKKAQKNYDVGTSPFELVAYYTGYRQSPPPNASAFVEATLGLIPVSMLHTGPWTRLWVFEHHTNEIIWVKARDEDS